MVQYTEWHRPTTRVRPVARVRYWMFIAMGLV